MARSMGYQYETSPRKLEPEYIPVRKKAKKHGFFSRIKGNVLKSRRAKKRKKLCA